MMPAVAATCSIITKNPNSDSKKSLKSRSSPAKEQVKAPDNILLPKLKQTKKYDQVVLFHFFI